MVLDKLRCPLFSSGLLVTAWLYANFSSLAWLWRSLGAVSPLNLLLVMVGITALLVQAVRNRDALSLSPTPVLRPAPVLLMLGSGIGAIAVQSVWDIQQIPALLFALGSYGLCGLFLTPTVWRKGFPIAVLVACMLPFSTQMGTGLGLPLRILTAQTVEHLLNAWQITAISSHDIIVLENGIAQVDLPCSGLKSLWTGTLILLAATWLERRQLGIRWVGVCGLNVLLLISANLMRVLLLVLITHVFRQPEIAHILHVPLGLLGFIFACAITWLILQWVPKQNVGTSWRRRGDMETQRHGELSISRSASPWLAFSISSYAQALLLAAVIALGLMASFHTPSQAAIALPKLPAQIKTEPIPLSTVEQEFFSNSSTTVSQKWRFASGTLKGSMLVVASQSWSAFHSPELCLVGNGFKVDSMESMHLTADVLARWLSLEQGQRSATYWLQSSQQTTDDFLSRFWEYVIHQNKTWVLVSILFDSPSDPNNHDVQNFVATLHTAIQSSTLPRRF